MNSLFNVLDRMVVDAGRIPVFTHFSIAGFG
jgi:hypothetical protein